MTCDMYNIYIVRGGGRKGIYDKMATVTHYILINTIGTPPPPSPPNNLYNVSVYILSTVCYITQCCNISNVSLCHNIWLKNNKIDQHWSSATKTLEALISFDHHISHLQNTLIFINVFLCVFILIL